MSQERIDMGRENGKEENHEQHLRGRARANLVLSGPVWSTNPYRTRTVCRTREALGPSRQRGPSDPILLSNNANCATAANKSQG